MNELLLSVPTLFGLESLAAREIRNLGYETCAVEDGRVSFYGDWRAVCRANLWLRVAERVQIKLGDFTAATFTELFDNVKSIAWPELLPEDAAFPVRGHSVSSKLFSVPDCQSIVKKAIVESMKAKYRAGQFAESGSLYRVQFNIIRDRVTVYVDTTGEALHKRGYREAATLAPIRETLAAALVGLSGWRPGMGLWDQFCGSGTIVIEAAMVALNIAPGLRREFAAERWQKPGGAQWEAARAEARAAIKDTPPAGGAAAGGTAAGNAAGRAGTWGTAAGRAAAGNVGGASPAAGGIALVGSDIERRAVITARENAKRAGVGAVTRFFQMDATRAAPDHAQLPGLDVRFPARSVLVANPPYGERLDGQLSEKPSGQPGEQPYAGELCREWGGALALFRHWAWCVISSREDFEREIGRRASKRRKLYNGNIKCQAYMYKAESQ